MEIAARFMTMAEILAMQSADAEAELAYQAEGFGNRYGITVTGSTVADILPVKLRDLSADPEYYGAVRESMMAGQTVPLGAYDGCMLNGLHRVAIALLMDLPGLYVGESFEGSSDESFDEHHHRNVLAATPMAA